MVRTANFRRFHEKLKKLQIKRRLKSTGDEIDRKAAEDERYVGMMARTPHPCSCDMCCNARRLRLGSKKDKLSLQEKRSNLDLTDME